MFLLLLWVVSCTQASLGEYCARQLTRLPGNILVGMGLRSPWEDYLRALPQEQRAYLQPYGEMAVALKPLWTFQENRILTRPEATWTFDIAPALGGILLRAYPQEFEYGSHLYTLLRARLKARELGQPSIDWFQVREILQPRTHLFFHDPRLAIPYLNAIGQVPPVPPRGVQEELLVTLARWEAVVRRMFLYFHYLTVEPPMEVTLWRRNKWEDLQHWVIAGSGVLPGYTQKLLFRRGHPLVQERADAMAEMIGELPLPFPRQRVPRPEWYDLLVTSINELRDPI